ncbi:hypothetical protein BJX62DRAFT_207736 [Aspergillus germanicus]
MRRIDHAAQLTHQPHHIIITSCKPSHQNSVMDARIAAHCQIQRSDIMPGDNRGWLVLDIKMIA